MTMSGIKEISFMNVNFEPTQKQSNVSNEPIFKFNNNDVTSQQDISAGKLETEMFIQKLMRNLDKSKMQKTPKTVEYYLRKLIEVAQTLNGVQKNNLKPQGNSKQNEFYNLRIQEFKENLKDYADFIGSDLGVVQDSKTGLYKISINNRLYNIPERNVEIVQEETLDMIELMPSIVEENNTLISY